MIVCWYSFRKLIDLLQNGTREQEIETLWNFLFCFLFAILLFLLLTSKNPYIKDLKSQNRRCTSWTKGKNTMKGFERVAQSDFHFSFHSVVSFQCIHYAHVVDANLTRVYVYPYSQFSTWTHRSFSANQACFKHLVTVTSLATWLPRPSFIEVSEFPKTFWRCCVGMKSKCLSVCWEVSPRKNQAVQTGSLQPALLFFV